MLTLYLNEKYFREVFESSSDINSDEQQYVGSSCRPYCEVLHVSLYSEGVAKSEYKRNSNLTKDS